MASASDFLKKRTAARQQAESIQSSDKTPLGKNDDGTVTRASNFLRNKAAERRAVIDQQYGKDAYGGSGRYEADKAQGFNSWLESVNGLSSQLGSDYQSRDGKFQSAADFGKYRDDNDARISVMQNRANAYRTYFQDNREIYGEDAVNGVLSTLDQGSKYLEELRGGLNSEYDFWSQFKDEDDYKTYKKGREYAALGSADREIGQYGKGNIDLYSRPQYQNPDGSISTVDSASYNIDGKEVLLPTVWMKNGRAYHSHNDEEILQHYKETGEYLGKFDTPEEADAYGEKLHNAQDFYYGSQYKSTANGQEKFNAWSGTYSNSGFDDIAYDYINRNEEARSRQMLSDIQSNASLLGLDNSERREMTDDEIATFNYLYAQDTANGDAEHKNAYAYVEFLTGDLNYRQRAKAEEEWAAYANEHPVGSSVFSVLESPLKGLSYLGQAADYLDDGKIDQNEGYNKFSYINSAIRNEVNTIVEDNWGGVGSFAYQTGMSMGDFLFNTAITGGNQALSLAIMGTGAAADATISAKDRGLSDNQAFALGTIAGAAEIITEKVSLEALLDTTALTKSAMGYFLKNTLAEGSEEVGSDIINLVADVLISKDKSEWQTSIDAYEAEGMTEKEAFWRAVRDQAENMGLDFLGGAVSGGVMSGAGIAINAGLNEYGARRTGAEFQAMGDDVVQATIQEGLASDPSTQSYKLAVQLQQKLDAGQTLTNAEIGRLYQANVQAIDAEDGSGDLLLRAAEEVTQKGRVTNNTAIDILSNPTAINTLTQEAGLNISEDMSKSQQRKAVKSAVETLARAQTEVSVNTEETTPAAPQTQQTATQRPVAQQAHDIRRVRDASSALGENGAKALAASYDGNIRSDEYYAGFASYYEAGINGADMAKVDSDYGSRLTEAQRFAAYSAGQNDAALSLQREQQAAKYAKVAGEDSGLVYDDFVKQAVESGRTVTDINGENRVYLTAETAAKVNSVAKALGVRVQFVDSVRGGTANAQISGSTVLVERNNPNPVLAIVGHEMTHRMQELAPTEYRTFRDIVAQEEQSSIQKRIDTYAAQGVELTYEQAMDEVAADYAGRLIDDGKVLDDFIERHRDDRTLLQKVRDAIRSLIDKLTGAEKKKAQTAEGKLTAALEAAARQAKTLQGEGGNDTMAATRHSMKEDRENGRKGAVGTGAYENLHGEARRADGRAGEENQRVRGELSNASGRHGGVNPSFGAKPVRTWAEGHTVEPAKGSVAYTEQQTAMDYGVPSFVVSDAAWAENKGSAPAFSAGGQIYFRETLPEKNRGMFAPHEITHVMRQVGYKPYLDFVERTPMMLNMSDKTTIALLNHVAEHQHTTMENADPARLYDEFNATMYGHIAAGQIEMFISGDGADVFHDFDAYAKELGELHERFKADNQKETKFSLKAPVEETDKLLALHNKDENSILAALKLGGLPMPSIAIVKARDGHTKYGPISLVFSKDTIDPQLSRVNKVYGGDAWTPTAPRVDYPVNSKKASQLERELHRLAGDTSVAGGIFGNSTALRSMGIDDTSTRNTAELAEKLASTDTVRAAYLADQGESLDAVYRTKEFDSFGNEALQSYLDKVGEQEAARLAAKLMTGERLNADEAEAVKDAIMESWTAENEWRLNRKPELRETRIARQRAKLSDLRVEDFARNAWELYQDGGATKGEIDRTATSDALRSAVDDRAVEAWIAGKLDGLLGEGGIYNGKDPYTPSGNLRSFSQLHYAYTLENIVKAMKEGQEERGGNTWGVSAKTLQSVATPEYRSIQEIKADSGRLGMDEGAEYEAKLQAIDDQIGSIITKIKQGNKAHSDNSFVESDIIGSILVETAKGKKTVDAIMRAFSKEGYKISSQTAQDIQTAYKAAAGMPTGYFEAKPQRAVGFDEVLAAVIPDDSSQKLRDGLEQAGVRMLEYKTGDDTDRLAKINSVDDARFSLKAGTESKSVAALQEENRLLREQMKDYIALQRRNGTLQESRDYWRGQTRRTQRVTTDKKAVTAAAKQLIQNYGADIAVKDIQGDLQSLYDYIASGYDGKDELTYTEARRRAEDIAETLVSNAVAVDSDMYDAYSDLRDYLRTTKIIYGKEYHGDIADYGDFRKRQFGRLNLGSEGHTNIDQVYQELSSRWPEFFSEQEQTHPADQLLHIVEVLDGISEINEYNPFSRYMDQAVTGAANEIMETFFDLPQTRKTFADQQALKLENAKAKGREQVQKVREQYTTRLAEQKARSEERLDQAILGEKMAGGRELAKQKRLDAERIQKVREQNAARLAELREQNRQRVQNAIAKERETRARQMDALKDRYAAKDAAGRERRAARELRAKITRHASALSQKLLRPSDQHHIPEAMRGSVAAMLESINQESQYTLDENGKRVKDGSGTPTKRTEAFRALKEQYAKIVAEGGDMVIDPSLLGSDADGIKGGFDAVIAMKDTKLADMSVAQLQTVWQVVKAVEHSVNTAGKVLSKAKYARTADWAQAISIGTSSRRAKNSLTRNHALIDLETPYTFFSHYGEAGKAVYRMLRDAQDLQQLMVDHVAEEVRKIVDPKTVKKLEATTHTFTTERGEKLTLSTAQVMELYELVKRKQAHDHLLKGGVVQPEIKTSQIRRGTDSIRLTEGDLVNITGTLTPEQVKIADGLQGLTRGVLADYGNKASMEAYGYKKFTESDYWPIKSAKEGLHSNIEKGGNNTRSIKNIGMAKTTMPHASNALDLAGIFTTFANHASDMTDYASWLCTMEDINRLFNYQFRDEEGNPTGKTIKSLLDRVGGPNSQVYWHNLMEDIQNGINARSDTASGYLIDKTIGNFKGAAVGANIRVVIQQPTAFFRAAAVLDPQDMARGLARGVTRGSGWKKALQYSPIAMRKDAGGFDISSPYQMTETLFDNRTNVRKLNDALSAPAGAADAVTWGKLWNACEWATAREHQGLTKGSEAFYRQTAKLFAEVIDQTQVVDGVLQRSQIMRSSNAIYKQATSFMGEPIMSLNLLMRAYDQVRYEQNSQKRGKAIKTMGRAATALVVTNVVNALAQSLIDAMRDDDEDKKYWERFRAAFTGISGDEETPWEKAWNAIMEGNVGSNMNPLGQIPFVKDALSIMQGYDVSRTEMEIVSDLIQAGQTAIQSADGQGKRTRAYALKGLLAAGAKMFGIPASNLTRDMWGLARSAAVETGNIPLQYELEKAIYNISNTGNKNRYYAILYRALEQGDMDTYQHIRDDLMNSMGVDGASIDSAMRSRYNKAVEKDPDYTLPQRARDLIGSRDKYAPVKEKEETFGADDLGSSAYRAYSDQRASDYRSMADDLTSSPIFQGMDDETRDKVLKAAYDLADKSALADHSDGQYEVSTKWMAQADDAEAQGIEPWEYVLFHIAYNETEGTKDADGKTVKGEAKSDHVREWLEDFSGLTDEQRAFLWGTVYTSEW